MSKIALVLIGPTASGKTTLGIQLAQKLNGEVICMDSTTVYQGFDIGSAKPTAEERAKVPHHMVDLVLPSADFSAHDFITGAAEAAAKIKSAGKLPIFVGGTYFYLRALQHGMYPIPPVSEEVVESLEKEYLDDESTGLAAMHAELATRDPETAKAIHPNDRYRILRALAIIRGTGKLPSELKPVPVHESLSNVLWVKYAIVVSRHQLTQAITARTENMLRNGLVDETKRLLQEYGHAKAMGSIGYSEARKFIEGKITEKQLRTEIIERTRQLAKRQLTWLRSDPEVRFIDHRDVERMIFETGNLMDALKGVA